MPLTTDQRALLQLMLDDNRRAGQPFSPTDFWDLETRRFEHVFEKFGINQVEDEFYNTRFSGLLQSSTLLYPWFLRTLYHLLKSRDRLGLFDRLEATAPLRPTYSFALKADQPPLPVGYAIMVDGRKVSIDLLLSIHELYSMLDHIPELATEEMVVAELGAGWGRLAHVLLQVNPRLHYLILDIPVSLLVSSTYLPRVLSQVSVAGYQETRARGVLTRDWLRTVSLAFAGPQMLPAIEPGAVDLFIQVGGLQEMTPDQANAYLAEVDGVMPRGKVYLKNTWVGARSSFSDFRFPRRWRLLERRTPDYAEEMFEAFFDLGSGG